MDLRQRRVGLVDTEVQVGAGVAQPLSVPFGAPSHPESLHNRSCGLRGLGVRKVVDPVASEPACVSRTPFNGSSECAPGSTLAPTVIRLKADPKERLLVAAPEADE